MLEARSGLFGVATFVGRNHVDQAGKPDDLLSWVSLSCIMVDIVSPRMGEICDVTCPIPPSRAGYDVFDASCVCPSCQTLPGAGPEKSSMC